MHYRLVVLSLLLASVSPARAQISVSVGLPRISIGIDVPAYPELVQVPGYPVYYDPRASANYFFYDGLYWVYAEDRWYSSDWYNGPWYVVGPEYVPLFVLRVPVRYYRRPPAYFRGWHGDAPPRWGEHWGRDWEARRGHWARWDRGSTPPPAPLPVYQRHYTGDRYPRATEQQHALRSEHYRYKPRDVVMREEHHAQPPRAEHQAQPAERREHQAQPAERREHQAQPAERREHQAQPPARPERQAQPAAPAESPRPDKGHQAKDEAKESPGRAAKGSGHDKRRDDERGGERGDRHD